MNWGKGIAIALALFIGFIMYMVVNMMSTKIDLESEDYYQKEINYSTELKSINRDRQFKNRPKVSVTDQHLVVQLPSDVELTNVQLFLQRSNDDRNDRTYPIIGTKTFTVAKSKLEVGGYDLVLTYEIEGESYIQKREIAI